MNPIDKSESDWAEKAVEEIAQGKFGWQPEDTIRAVEIIKRHMREEIDSWDPSSFEDKNFEVSFPELELETKGGSVIRVTGTLSAANLQKITNNMAGALARGQERLKEPKTFSNLCRYFVRDCWRLWRGKNRRNA